MANVKVRDLGLGDAVRVGNFLEYSTATVYKKDENGDAHVWRPYVMTSDFSYSGNRVIPYIGLEDFTLLADTVVDRIRPGDPKQ